MVYMNRKKTSCSIEWQVIGRDLHLTAVLGRTCIKEAHEELDLEEDFSWVEASGPPAYQGVETLARATGVQPEQPAHAAAQRESLGSADEADMEKRKSSSWLAWESFDPGFVSIQSQNLKVTGNGWRRRSDGAYTLKEPGHLEFQYTPALAQ